MQTFTRPAANRPPATPELSQVLQSTRHPAPCVPQRRTPAAPAPLTLKHQPRRGVTLIELMIVVVVMAVLLAVAYPSYLGALRKGRRAEGIAALMAIQQAQERYRANNAKYGALAVLTGVHANTANGLYTLAVLNPDESNYTIVATAAGSQAQDTACKQMGVQSLGGNLRYGSSSEAIAWLLADPDSGKCWAK